MNQKEILLNIEGDTVKTLVFTELALQFLNKKIYSVEEFKVQWEKKLTIITATEIKFKNIKSIASEKNSNAIMIKYKTFGFLPSELEFTFDGLQDLEYFFEILVSQQYFYKAEKHLNFLQANFRYLLGLALVALCTIVGYNTAIDIENGVEDKSTSGKQVIFNFIVKFLGKYGVLLLGATIAFYILKKIWSRFKIPPFQIKYLPLSA